MTALDLVLDTRKGYLFIADGNLQIEQGLFFLMGDTELMITEISS